MSHTVIVVDDEVHTTRLVSRLLTRNGFNVIVAHSGDEAIGKLQYEDADVMLLDIMMPGAPPKKVIEVLKNQGKKIKIFYFSALKEKDEASIRVRKELVPEEAEEYIYGYIEKPFSNEDLLNRIRKVLEDE